MSEYSSWGHIPESRPGQIVELSESSRLLKETASLNPPLLAYGNGRSYGDVCLNNGGTLLDTRKLNALLNFDTEQGVLRCEAGILIADLLEITVPEGWILPVMPGTRFVTLGGAIANDIHGKNHHQKGSFGCHVNRFELLRSDGSSFNCSVNENSGLYHATIGGLGLTGLITQAEIQLQKIASEIIEYQELPFTSIAEFIKLSEDSAGDWEYTVAWIDCLARGNKLGRGIFSRGRHSQTNSAKARKPAKALSFPFKPGFSLVNGASIKAFNSLYYWRHANNPALKTCHYQKFFFPLDNIHHWNRIYGRHGFYQYQCVIPKPQDGEGIEKLLDIIAQSGTGSFLSVLKSFGDINSPGLLSFPKQGLTLALDFPNRGEKTLALLDQLDAILMQYGGAIYPAKDARVASDNFKEFFPNIATFTQYIDPAFSSSFWRRVSQ